jgi:hypothetical protein
MWFGGLSFWDRAIYGGNLPNAVFNFTTASLDPRITYTHTFANSWGFDAAGLLVNYPATTPRFDYGPMGGGAIRGIRIDQSSLSVSALHCRDFTNAAWAKTSVTAAKDAIGLDGVAASCSTLTATGANGKVTQSITSASGARVVFAYVKRKTGTGRIWLTLDDGSTTTEITSLINASTFSMVYATQTLANPVTGFVIETSGDEIIADAFTFDVGTIPTTPILTTGSNVQRIRDDLTVTGSNFSDWFNAAEGTFVSDFIFDIASVAGTGPRLALAVDDTTANERIAIYGGHNGLSGNMGSIIVDGGVTVVSQSAGAVATASIRQRVGFAYKLNDSNGAANGTAVTADTACTIPTVTRLALGGLGSAGAQMNGVLERVRYWNRRLPDATLAALTAL